MDMDDSSNSTMAMKPYLHFTPGDALWLSVLAPKSKGAVAGACIFLFVLAMGERAWSAWSSSTQASWARSRAVMETDRPKLVSSQSNDSVTVAAPSSYPRRLPPFVLSHDIPRGLMFIGASILRYMLMLAVMTYSASFIISILVGLSVGEIAFGRFAQSVI